MNRRAERGFTLVEIMIVVAIIALLAAIAIPNVLRGRTTANEAASIGNLRALVSSQEMYRSVNNRYSQTATWQANMYTNPDPDFGPPSFNLDLSAAQTVQGYNYTYAGLPAGCTDAAGNCTQYTLSTVAQTLGRTGVRSFIADDTGVIRHCTATAQGQTADPTGAGQDATIDAPPVNCD